MNISPFILLPHFVSLSLNLPSHASHFSPSLYVCVCVKVVNSTFTHTHTNRPYPAIKPEKGSKCRHQCLLKHFQCGWNVSVNDWRGRHVVDGLFPSGFPLPEPIIPNKTKKASKQVFVRVSRLTCSFSDTLSSLQREIGILSFQSSWGFALVGSPSHRCGLSCYKIWTCSAVWVITERKMMYAGWNIRGRGRKCKRFWLIN